MPHLPIRPNPPGGARASPGSSPPPHQQQPQQQKKKTKDNAVLFVNFSNPAVDRKAKNNKVAIKKWVTKRQHAAARSQASSTSTAAASPDLDLDEPAGASSAALVVSTPAPPASSRESSPPFRLLGAQPVDPFATLPFDVSALASQLVHGYLNASTASLAAFANREHTRTLLSVIRKNAWHPIAIHSRAAYGAMVAFAQVSQDFDSPSAQLCLRHHMSLALTAANAELASLQTARSSDALCYAVVLLMLTAQRLNEPGSFHAHARGLSALIFRRARAKEAGDDISAAEQLRIDRETRQMAIGPKRWDSLLAPEKLHPTIPHVPGFHQLMDHGLCSTVTASFLAQVVATFELCLQAQGDWLVINSMFQHAFVDDGVYKRVWANSPDQVYLILCSRLCQHHALWPMREHPCHTTEFAVTSLHRQLQAIDTARILAVCPGAMLWVSIIGGAGTVGPLQLYYAWLMREASRRLPHLHSYYDVRSYLYQNFLWAPGADQSAQAFWDSAFNGSPRASPSPSGPSDDEGSDSGSPKQRKKKRPDPVDFSAPALLRGPADLGMCSGAPRPDVSLFAASGRASND